VSTTISFKVSRQIKEKMVELSSKIEWPEEIRNYIMERIKQVERQKAIEETEKMLENVRPAPEGTSTRLLRENRDSH